MSPEANYPVEPADNSATDYAGIQNNESVAAMAKHALVMVMIKEDAK